MIVVRIFVRKNVFKPLLSEPVRALPIGIEGFAVPHLKFGLRVQSAFDGDTVDVAGGGGAGQRREKGVDLVGEGFAGGEGEGEVAKEGDGGGFVAGFASETE